MKRFIIVGLPRSGTTYLMTLLNSHPHIHCSGEQFNPYAIVGIEDDLVTDRDALVARDREPVRFFEGFFERHTASAPIVGFKYMLGHSPQVLSHLRSCPDMTILYVHRENRLAQAASYAKAIKSRIWAQTGDDALSEAKLGISPQYYKQLIDEAGSLDALFREFSKSIPNVVYRIEYKDLFVSDFGDCICDILGARRAVRLSSNIGKQGVDNIIDRFENRDEIADYFTKLGNADWLGPEIGGHSVGFEYAHSVL